ncbi:MAG TPA: hypothetical protein VM284_01415 [Candidatus Limnocylindria bacterium]|nr:hypothetical protein [Candidatus Limnocylindria bacterium]
MPDQPRRRHARLRLLGLVLAAYGLIGLMLFVAVAVAVNRPLERAHELSVSVDEQRAALVATMGQARTTLEDMSLGVGAVDESLADAKAATDRAAGISTNLATTMYGLRDAMSISIFGAQPLVGLASGFDSSGQQMSALGTDLATIGTSLNDNRTAVSMTSSNLAKLALSLGELTALVRDSPDVEISTASLDAIRLAVYAICGWLAVLALGCVVGGLYLVRLGGRSRLATY